MTASLVEAHNSFLDTEVTTAGSASSSGSGARAALFAGPLPSMAFGTTSGVRRVVQWTEQLELITTTPAVGPSAAPMSVTDEVRRLRDQICSHGLTRQDVARAIGVDRRSLSAWVSGEMRPAPERLGALHLLARLVRLISSEQPGRVRDIMVARRSGTALIDRVASEGAHVLETWRAATRPEATVTLGSASECTREPIWAAASRAAAEGRLRPPTWERTVRPASTYEMDLKEASVLAEPETKVRRRGYK